MNKKEFVAQNLGNDKIAGRPIRLNQVTLETKAGKDYAEVVLWGDVHYGARNCNIEKAKGMLDYCLENNIYLLGMGDLLESATRYSVGSGVYEQESPQKQIDDMTAWLEPLAEKGLILGLHTGNHEGRITKETGIDIMKMISKSLGVTYLGSACWNLFKVNKQNYLVYSLHGSSGSRYVYTKLKSLVDISHNFDADLICQGHINDCADTSMIVQKIDLRSKTVIEHKKFLVLSGHYLKYDNSYAQDKGFPIGKEGSPKIKFFSEKKDIHISF